MLVDGYDKLKEVEKQLIQAVDQNSKSDVKYFLENNFMSLEAKNLALWLAATQGKYGIQKILRKHDGDFYYEADGNLNNAAMHGNIDGMRLAIQIGAEVGNASHYPLKMAIMHNHLEAADFLHRRGGLISYAIKSEDLQKLWSKYGKDCQKMLAWVSEMQLKDGGAEVKQQQVNNYGGLNIC